ncbi:MAG: hypothetical protein RLY47_317 [Candidatus Parcubacteria bacterium]|jgi:hypothetical protein
MSWASRRRALYLLGLIVAFAIIIGVPTYFFFHEEPTCTDGIQNGLEDGVDCGGNCPIICSFSAADALTQWSRLFNVIPGVYSTLALVENPNATVGAVDVPYSFKLRGADNVLVYEKKGLISLPPKSVIPIFETGLQTGSRIPTRSEFTLGEPVWVRQDELPYDISVRDEKIENEATQPTVTAILHNDTTDAVGEFAAVAILYDIEGNALHASRTIVDGLDALAETRVVFTWPQPFSDSVAQIDIIPVFSDR